MKLVLWFLHKRTTLRPRHVSWSFYLYNSIRYKESDHISYICFNVVNTRVLPCPWLDDDSRRDFIWATCTFDVTADVFTKRPFNPTWYFTLDCGVLAQKLTRGMGVTIHKDSPICASLQLLLLKSRSSSMQTSELMWREAAWGCAHLESQTPRQAGNSRKAISRCQHSLRLAVCLFLRALSLALNEIYVPAAETYCSLPPNDTELQPRKTTETGNEQVEELWFLFFFSGTDSLVSQLETLPGLFSPARRRRIGPIFWFSSIMSFWLIF